MAAIVSTLVSAAFPLALAAPAAAAPCSDIEVIFARGTNDAPGLGRPGQAFADGLSSRLGGRSVSTYAVNYPASYDFLAAADGANDAANRIATLASSCPSTRVVLGGYSQGAAVVDMLAGIPPLGNKVGEIGSAPPLAGELVPQVAAVAVFGNPSAKFGIPITSSVFGGKAIDLCKDGDPICSRGRNPFAHSDYVTSGMADQAANFVAGIV
ncbi:cutinase [Mycolicibacterium boenickei]|uniref:Cutinase n=1 Tax=Mycolicibacterium boenickei TaxID=146017 RepID=A0ABM7J5D4_9MYCO|nr:cutinase [Mycolicibacterium boenickei]